MQLLFGETTVSVCSDTNGNQIGLSQFLFKQNKAATTFLAELSQGMVK